MLMFDGFVFERPDPSREQLRQRARAQHNIRELITRLDGSKVDLAICDVSEDAERAEADRILFTPTLVVRRPLLTWIVGDLTNGEEVLRVLRAVETEERP